MSGGAAAPHVVEDFVGVIQLLSDGTVVRGDESVLMPELQPIQDIPGVQWKDVVYDATHGLRVRMYRPSSPASGEEGGGGGKLLPVLVYFHGGGYCIGAIEQPGFHAFCLRAASELPAVVLSVQYRLAPEHRLPAAIDDGAAFFTWLSGQAALGAAGADPWLSESADFARTFVSGVSAGANLAHHVAARVGSGQLALGPPLRIAGCVLLSAFFGGVDRTASEANPAADVSLAVEMCELLWRLALPEGATRDHPAANLFGPDSPSLAPVALPPVLVVAPGSDVLRDRVHGYAARLKEIGKDVELAEFEGEQHGFCVLRPWGEATSKLIQLMKRFVHQGGMPN